MSQEIAIRTASPADVEIIATFNSAMALETEHKHLDPATISAGVARFVADPRLGFYLVAECDGEIAGCLGITYEWSDWRNGLFWWIQSVYVSPSHRRHGVFSRLYAHVGELAAAEPDVCGIRLYVEKDNMRAMDTYRALGMTETDYRLFETLLH